MSEAPSHNLLFVTGTRADFGKLEPLAIAARDAGHKITFFVTGMHMMERYGLTKIEVARMQGVEVVEFENQQEGDRQDQVIARTMEGFADYLQANTPDLAIVHGDRAEALACALVCATNYIRCAHIEGGEVSGTIDESFRHCNTKLAWAHFVSSEQARDRVFAMGEDPSAVFLIGSPELDTHLRPSGVTLDEVKAHYDIPFEDYGIVVFHPVTSEQETIGQQAQSLFKALDQTGKNFVVILPNNDPGSDQIFDAIEALDPGRFRSLASMRFAYFSELLRNASALIGNSSAGVREAPFIGTPSLDIGTRQTNRSQASSVFHADADNADAITSFIDQAWGKRFERDAGFGSGSAAQNFVDCLADPAFWTRGFQKNFRDIG
ncbi:MAG: UDP-N-acetylglucosamine 2-epimerase [Pseudomonadota bacterium]